MKKKFLAFLLAALMVVSLLPTVALAAWSGTGDGTTGNPWLIGKDTPSNVTAVLDNGTLTISGTGAIMDFENANDTPWFTKGNTTTLVIGSDITSIGVNAFCHLIYVTSLNLPEGLTSIDQYAFSECIGLTSLTIPKSVKSIGYSAFAECSKLESVTLPDGVETIGDYAFLANKKLKSVTLPSGLKTIGEGLFDECESLESLTIPASVESIGGMAFSLSGLKSVTIPAGVKSIGESAFYDCESLTTMTVKAKNPPTFGEAMLGDADCLTKLTTIYVPAGAVDTYKTATGWIDYADIIKGAYFVDTEAQGKGTVTVDKDCFPTDTYTAATDTVNVTVTPDTGYQLKSLVWNDGTDHDITEAKSFTMPTTSVTVKAEFEEAEEPAPTYGIISEVQGHGSVTTKIGDADVTEAAEGASVKFTPTADPGYQFKEWVDVRSNANISGHTTDIPLTVTMPAAEIKIKAVFEKAAPTVTIETNGHGTVTAYIDDGVDGITDSTFTVPAGSKVTLYSVADEGYHLNEWVDMRSNVTITNGNTFIMPDKDVKIKAVYSDTLRADYLGYIEGYYDNDMFPGDFSTLVNSDGMTQFMYGEGTLQTWDKLDIVAEELIVSTDTEEDLGMSAGNYTAYVIVTTETGNSGFKTVFYKPQDGKCQKTYNPVVGTYTRTAQPFNIIVEDDGHGTAEAQIDSTAVESAATGADVDLVITSTNEGYAFKEWQIIRGLESGAITDNSFTMPGNEVKLKAIFERVYNINIQDDGHGTAVAKIGDSEVNAAAGGNGITLVPQAAEGYELDRWEIVSGDFTITGNGFTMPESNVTIKAIFKVKEVSDCEYTKTVKLSENGKYGMKLNCKDMGEFTFAQFDGGWSINNGSKYLAMKDGKLALSDDPFAWTYKSGAFSASVKTTQKSSGYWFGFIYIPGRGSKTVTTTYYLSTVTENAKLSTCCVCAELYKTVTANEHDFGCWIDCKDGNHKHICKNCGEVETDVHHYGADDKCEQCGAFDSTKANVKISVVDVKTKTTKQFSGFLFWGTWKNVTTYTATIKTEATGVKVCKVEYQLNGSSKWLPGTIVCSDKPIDSLKVKVTDNKGKTYNYEYPEAPAADFTVTFNMNGHGDPISSITNVTSGATIDKPNDPTADGYVFKGWFKDEACENEWNFESDTVTKDTTLYAKWNITLGGLMSLYNSGFPNSFENGWFWEEPGDDIKMFYSGDGLKAGPEDAILLVTPSSELTSVSGGYKYESNLEALGDYSVTFVVSETTITSVIIALQNDDNELGVKVGTYAPAAE